VISSSTLLAASGTQRTRKRNKGRISISKTVKKTVWIFYAARIYTTADKYIIKESAQNSKHLGRRALRNTGQVAVSDNTPSREEVKTQIISAIVILNNVKMKRPPAYGTASTLSTMRRIKKEQ
jgi:hypothetical protein